MRRWLGVLLLGCAAAGPAPRSAQESVEEAGMDEVVDLLLTRCSPPIEGDLAGYVDRVGRRLVRAIGGRATQPARWRFRVLDLDVANAWAAPAGSVYVTRGLIVHLDSEAELATVLAHEMGHVVSGHGRDAARGDEEPTGDRLGRWVTYQRDEERQADEWAVQLAQRAGYDGAAAVSMLRALHRAHGIGAEDARTFGWADRHPPLAVRLARTEALVRPGGHRRRRRFLRRLEGLAIERRAAANQEPVTGLHFPLGWSAPGERCQLRVAGGRMFSYGTSADASRGDPIAGVEDARLDASDDGTRLLLRRRGVTLEFDGRVSDRVGLRALALQLGFSAVPGTRVHLCQLPRGAVVADACGPLDPDATRALGTDPDAVSTRRWVRIARAHPDVRRPE